MVDDNLDARKFSADDLRDLFEPNFETRSTCHDSLGCECCDRIKNPRGEHVESVSTQASSHVLLLLSFSPPHPGEPVEDENGYSHLLPFTPALRAVDTCPAGIYSPMC